MFDTMCSCLSFDVNDLFFCNEVIQCSCMIYVMDYASCYVQECVDELYKFWLTSYVINYECYYVQVHVI